MLKTKKLWTIVLAVALLAAAVLACGPSPGSGGGPSVTITSLPEGTTVSVGQAVEIASQATAGAGVARVELSVNGVAVRSDAPPSGNPTLFSIAQPWVPETEGLVTIGVVAYDVEGAASEMATIRLQVAAAAAGAPTQTPEPPAGEPPTGEPPTPEPTPMPEPDVTTEAGCTLNATCVADVTIPDDTVLAPGTSFVKTWRIRNNGTCDWTAGFRFVFVGGDQMGGEAQVAVPPTAAGSTADLSVNLTAPAAPGTYRGNWRMQSDTGLAFGSTVYVRIVVPAPATDTPEPTDTPKPMGTPTVFPANHHSLGAYNHPGYYVRHSSFMGELTEVSSDSGQQDSTFIFMPGLADSHCVSFQSINYSGFYLRHYDFRIRLHGFEDTQRFREDATFCERPGLANPALVSFESYNYPGYFLRHRDFHLYIEQSDSDLFRADATFRIIDPLWQ